MADGNDNKNMYLSQRVGFKRLFKKVHLRVLRRDMEGALHYSESLRPKQARAFFGGRFPLFLFASNHQCFSLPLVGETSKAGSNGLCLTKKRPRPSNKRQRGLPLLYHLHRHKEKGLRWPRMD